jgi:hypothetical protein
MEVPKIRNGMLPNNAMEQQYYHKKYAFITKRIKVREVFYDEAIICVPIVNNSSSANFI